MPARFGAFPRGDGMSTPENVRYHAAGHVAAAHLLAQTGDAESAKKVLRVVKQYTERPTVSAPPAIGELLTDAIAEPTARLQEIAQLETWLVDPFNTIIERSGAVFK